MSRNLCQWSPSLSIFFCSEPWLVNLNTDQIFNIVKKKKKKDIYNGTMIQFTTCNVFSYCVFLFVKPQFVYYWKKYLVGQKKREQNGQYMRKKIQNSV